MCELLGMSSNIPATLRLSLMKLAEHGGLTGPHKDGWGVGFYEGRDVRLIKEAEMAADSDWIRFLADHDLRSSMIIAHVRRATMGDRSYRNTQPFARELGGRRTALTAHLVMPGGHPGDAILKQISEELEHNFSIDHVTLQIETDEFAACALEPDDVI